MNSFNRLVVLPTAALSAITGGVLFAFSVLVMPALHHVSTPSAISAMQQINLVAPKSILMLPLMGSLIGSLAICVWAYRHRRVSSSRWLLVGAVAGVVSFAITAAINIPKNDALATIDPNAATSASAWVDYMRTWTAANHVRSLMSIVSAVGLVLATRSQRAAI